MIAVALIQKAYAHLPDSSRAGAIAQADTAAIRDALKAITLEAYNAGLQSGLKRGRAELEREMEDDWKPVAERAVRQAVRPGRTEMQRAVDEFTNAGPEYFGGPVEAW